MKQTDNFIDNNNETANGYISYLFPKRQLHEVYGVPYKGVKVMHTRHFEFQGRKDLLSDSNPFT